MVFTNCKYTARARSYGLQQELFTPHCPQQNSMIEHVSRSLKEHRGHRHRFETLQYAQPRHQRLDAVLAPSAPHLALKTKTPLEHSL